MIGSVGFSGAKSWPVEYGGREFIKWMIENMVYDVIVVNEHQLDRDDLDNITQYIGKERMHADIEKYNG